MPRVAELVGQEAKAHRLFFTIGTFDKVQIRIPKLGRERMCVASVINIDAHSASDPEHFFDGVPLPSGIFVNRHYYLPLHELGAGNVRVVRAVVVLEKMDSGRNYVRINFYSYTDGKRRRAKYEIQYKATDEVGNHVINVPDASESVIFRRIA